MGFRPLTKGLTPGFKLTLGTYTGLLIALCFIEVVTAENGGKYGYFSQENSSSVLLRNAVWNVKTSGQQTEFSFRTCSNGQLLKQTGASGDLLKLLLINGTLEFHWTIRNIQDSTTVGMNLNNDEWWTLTIQRYLGNVYLNVTQSGRVYFSEIISNSTFRSYFSNIDLTGTEGLYIGREYTGCLMEGPTVIFSNNNPNTIWNNVIWSNTSCPQHDANCAIENGDINDCYSHPCNNGGTCVDGENSFTCQCPHLYNGTNCENDLSIYGCDVSPCLNGGTCFDQASGTRNYRCECLNGFAGTNCEGDINECGTNPCNNNVQCIDKVGGFECNCTGSGYNGALCEEDINECNDTSICGTGQCFNNPGSFTCVCQDGYFGPKCQDINECQSSPCRNGATCQNQADSFNCVCVTGYTGVMCETDIDNCVNITCGGQFSECKDGVNNHTCVCKPGYRGTVPQCVEIDECQEYTPCRNGATCQNLVNNYTCSCVPGYGDKNCSTDIDECTSNPCQNGATCVDLLNGYRCDCVLGYSGNECQTDINECARQPCINGGTCIDLVNDYSCVCVLGYTGPRCQTEVDECSPNPCGINSTACTDGIGFFNCTCKPGYSGVRCQTDIDECNSNPCQNGAVCTDRINGYHCTCTPDWMGTDCSVQYDACSPVFQNCKNGATCISTPPSHDFSCTCVTGFTGNQCETNIDDCTPNPCTLPHVCFDEVDSYRCACPLGYEGQDCTTDIDECQSSPCQNGGTCINEIGKYTCQCNQRLASVTDSQNDRTWTYLTGYNGTNCEQDINECLVEPSICLHGGDCENEDGTFQCKCGRHTDGNYFSGLNCEVSTSYCNIHEVVNRDPPACKNGGSCRGLINNFTCDCIPGYEGWRCETDIDECASNPCQYNGTCVDGVNSYTCDCIDGITGDNCETNIDECSSNPCLHGGKCIDKINMFECNCTDTGFKGTTCETNIDDCEPEPCVNGGTCYDLIKDYSCSCFPGYTSKECQTDINECESSPCHFNSPCLQKSNQTLYDINHPGFENLTFSYANASGYLCECVEGSRGVNCEINIDDCQHDNCNNGTCFDLLNAYRCDCFPGFEGDYCDTEINECDRYLPCQYGSTCIDKIADYHCVCPPFFNGKPYAGKNCSFELTACQNNECHNGATCQPYLINETRREQDYECLCTEGFTGRYCNISTTMSFDNSYVKAKINMSVDVTLSFRFRTTLMESVLFAWIGQKSSINQLFTSIELSGGRVVVGYHNVGTSGFINTPVSNNKLNDGSWYKVELTKTNSHLSVMITGSKCASGCNLDVAYDPTIQTTQDGYFGSVLDATSLQKTVSKTKYVGCMEDITVWGTRLSLDIVNADHTFVSLTKGCPRTVQCFPDTCNYNGSCIDLWNKYKCDCYRPNLGLTCDTAYIAATFGFYNIPESTAEFSLSQDIQTVVQQKFDFSFFIRTRQETSLILFFGDLSTTFLTLELESGHLKVRMKFCAFERILLSNDDTYSDGQQHLVKFSRNGNISVFVDDNLLHQVNVPNDCTFNAQHLYFGGKTPNFSTGRRKKRQTIIMDGDIDDFTSVPSYKGTIQDVQLDQFTLQFYPLSDPTLTDLRPINITDSTGLTANEVSDPVCEMITPCDNNSTCSDVFFNDYSCECLLGYRGKNCSELDFCVTGTCPSGSTCQSLLDGFECISEATFDGKSSYAVYTHTLANTTQINSFSFKFRTLAMNAYILMIGNESRYFKLRLIGQNLVIQYKLDDSEEMLLTAYYPVSDSRWLLARVTDSMDSVTLTLYDLEEVTMYQNVSSQKRVNSVALNDLIMADGNEVKVGIRVSGVNIINSLYAYEGCLTELRIGGILLPFFTDEQFVNNTSRQKFLLQSHNFEHGCQAGQGCVDNQCGHGSTCIPDFYTYVCNCSSGYTGRWCQDHVDLCKEDSCVNGHCVDKMHTYECACPSGYMGNRCETDVDECNSNVTACQNNGSCQNENGTYSCSCPANFIGDMCQIPVTENCSDNPCVHGTCDMITTTHPTTNTQVSTFNCTCEAGYEGYKCDTPIDYCRDFPCENGATCVSNTALQKYTCTCVAGFTGDRCEQNIDDCVIDNICSNHGTCVDGVNMFSCQCGKFHTGSTCETDINECEITQPCQNQGRCLNENGSPGFNCNCGNTGYTGIFCETDIDECTTKPGICQNGGTCTNTNGSYTCNCSLGYKGNNCEIPDCDVVNCENGGVCNIVQAKWKCTCPQYYEGELCEIKGPCADQPCVNANTESCTQDVTTNNYTCHCKPGWEGQACDTDINECLNLDLCKNGATCVNSQGSFRCDCTLGFTDQFCGTNIDECASSPCKNNGYCIDGIGQFECNCTDTGYENVACEVDVNECEDNNPCYNGATCKNLEGSYECQCTDDFEGPKCEVKSQALMEDDITWYIVGPVIALVLILITIGVIWFLLCVRNKRATRGAYSPSRQEVTGSRVELGNVMKKPPLERLI